MPHTVKFGKRERLSYAKIPEIMDLPDLIEVQRESFDNFLQMNVPQDERKEIGLQAVFNEVFPITDFSETSSIEFDSYSLGKPKYDVAECQERGMTYAAPIKIKVRLVLREKDKDTDDKRVIDIKESEVYMGELPLMTERGTFIINGAERVIVSQLHRSPGAIFKEDTHSSGRKLHIVQIIPYRGAWIEFESDIKDLIHVRIDRRKKMHATVLLRAFGWESDEEIMRLFARTEVVSISSWESGGVLVPVAHSEKIVGRVLARDAIDPLNEDVVVEEGTVATELDLDNLRVAGIEQIYMLDDSFPHHLMGRVIATPIFAEEGEAEVDMDTGEETGRFILVNVNEKIDLPILSKLRDAGIEQIELLNSEDAEEIEFLLNTLRETNVKTQKPALMEIFRKLQPGDPPTFETAKNRVEKMFFDQVRYDLSRVGRYKLNQKLNMDVPEEVRVLRREDVIEVLKHLMKIQHGKGSVDDIDHLGNRRVRPVGELLQNQFRLGLSRVARTMKERLTIQDIETATPSEMINPKPLSGAIKDFFGSSQLSQFMQQTNPLDELTHKRRLSALGPGGLRRDRATFEVRDVHHTHYGRICPIETPEGPSVGLIVSLSTYARVNDYGFLESPYRKVEDGVATLQIDYLTATEEEEFVIAQANATLGEEGKLLDDQLITRYKGDFPRKPPSEVNYIDVSPKQVVSVSSALIPFLEHDDANRALMGSNMQRQAVPLLIPQAPIIGTGAEYKAALDSGSVVVALRDGLVESVSANEIIIRTDDTFVISGGEQSFSEMGYDVYRLLKFKRSNSGTCINQRPIVRVGEIVRSGQVIADGGSTDDGELALGANVLVAFLPWEGYNFEDAILISDKLVKDDILTSLHIEEFDMEARDTKLGKEEITIDLPNVGEDSTRDLDEEGIVLEGALIEPGDIIVGKVTPKGESDLGPEEKLLKAIFGEKAGDVRDASLRAKPGHEGVVVDVKVFSRKEREKDKLTKQREDARTKQIEQEYENKKALISERRNEEIQRMLLGKTLASSVSDGEETFGRVGDVITEEMLDSGVPIEQFFIADSETSNQITRIKHLAQGRIDALTLDQEEKIEKIRKGDELRPGVVKLVKVYVANKRKIQVGDKLAGRHGNKGVIAKILPAEDMPYLEDGTPVDIVLNPLGVPSRMNIGQILEAHLGWAAEELGLHIASPVFDGAQEEDIQQALIDAGLPPYGKTKLYDGRTGEPFAQDVTVGQAYILKLHHLVDDKIHARSIGPYSLVTQQPLGGKAQMGGQRFGEMEVWALEAYGAAYMLQEMLTTKSDDVSGRTSIYEAIVKGENAPEPGTPESFNVLVKELQSLGLDVRLEEISADNKKETSALSDSSEHQVDLPWSPEEAEQTEIEDNPDDGEVV